MRNEWRINRNGDASKPPESSEKLGDGERLEEAQRTTSHSLSLWILEIGENTGHEFPVKPGPALHKEPSTALQLMVIHG